MKPASLCSLIIIGMLVGPESHAQVDGMAPSASDGIIDSHEAVDSAVLQTHGNLGRDPATDIQSTYFLRNFITAQVDGFKYLGSEQDCFFPWALPLGSIITRSVGSEVRVVRYNLEKQKIPKYKYDYKYVTKTVYVREGGPTTVTPASEYDKEKRTPIGRLVEKTFSSREAVGARQVGFTTAMVKVYHPQGKFEEKSSVQVLKSTGTAKLVHGWHAANAQVAYTMIKAGLPPSDPQMKLIVQAFHNVLYAYGIPDNTEDVAWMTAFYANLPQDDPDVKLWSARLVSRLVTGAAHNGDHIGLWGPVCVNPEYLDKIVAYDAKFVKKNLEPLKQEILRETQERSKNRLQVKLGSSELLYEKWQKVYLTWAMAGTSVQEPRDFTSIPADEEGQRNFKFQYSLQVPGLVQDPYHFQFTDLESTCIALMALSEARAAGILKDTTLVPTDEKGSPIAKPLDVKSVLSSTNATLRKLRLRSGGWDSGYSALFHTTCREIPYSSVIPKDLYGQSAAENHWAYNVMGLACMDYLARIVGGDTSARISKDTAGYQVELIQWLLDHTSELDLPNAPNRGNLLYFLSDIIGSRSPDARFLWQQLGAVALREPLYIAALDQAEDYGSHAAALSLRAEADYFKSKPAPAAGDEDELKVKVSAAPSMRLNRIKSLNDRASLTYFLSQGIRQPVFAAVKPSSSNGACPALDHLMNIKYEGVLLNYFYVASAAEIAQYSTCLFLLMESRDDAIVSAAENTNLGKYLSRYDGTVVLLGLAGQSTAIMEQKIAAVLDQGGMQYRREESTNRGAHCIEYRVSDRLAAIIIDASADREARETYSNRLKIYRSLMQQKLPPLYLNRDFCLLPECLSKGELTKTGIEWETAGTNGNP